MIEGAMPTLYTFEFLHLKLPGPWKVFILFVHKELIYKYSLSASGDAAEIRFRWYIPGGLD